MIDKGAQQAPLRTWLLVPVVRCRSIFDSDRLVCFHEVKLSFLAIGAELRRIGRVVVRKGATRERV